MRAPKLLLAFALAVSVSCSTTTVNDQSTNSASSTSTDSGGETSTVVLTIPIGESGISYANTDVQESEPWGPSALRIAPDGSFLIVDTVTDSILRFRSDGTPMPRINVDNVAGITDVAADASSIYVLDESATVPAIVRLSTDGVLQEKRPLSPQLLRQGLSGLTLSTEGNVLLEFDGGGRTLAPDGKRELDKALRGRPYSVNVPSLRSQALEGARPFVSIGDQRVAEIKTDNPVAGLKVLGVNADGELFVLVEEIAVAPEVAIDQTIRRFDASGKQTGMARVPIRERYTHVAHAVAFGPDGQAFALVTYPDRAVVLRFNLTNQLQSILPKMSYQPDNATPIGNCTQTRPQITDRAKVYLDNKVFLNALNLDGQCPGRGKPRYLGSTPGEYPSVAYDWGGWDTVEAYNQFMAQNKQAGDIDSHGVELCSKGVDCSGFVTRCWGITSHKYGTATLPEISNAINSIDLLPGDILNRPGRHVVLFDRLATDADGGSGVMAWESTTTNKVDRVVYRRSSWGRLNGYTPRRYKQVC